MRHVALRAAAAAVSILAVVACSSTKSSTNTSTTSAKSTSSTSGGSSNTTAVTSGATDPACAYRDSLTKAAAIASGGSDAHAAADKVKSMLTYMSDHAPDSIKNDVATLNDAYGKFVDIVAKYDYDYTKLGEAAASDPSVQASLAAIGSPAVLTASANISSYFATTCGGTTATT